MVKTVKHKQPISNVKKAGNADQNTARALTIVEQGPKDDQARVDGYGKKIAINTTNYTDVLNKYADDMFKSYRGLGSALGKNIADLSKLPALQKLSGIVKALNPTNIIGRIENSILGGRSLKSVLQGAMQTVKDGKQLYEDFKNDTLGATEKYFGGLNFGGMNLGSMIRSGKMLYEEGRFIRDVVKYNDWGSLSGIIAGLEMIGGTSIGEALKGVIDLQATSAFLNHMVKEAADAGLLALPGMAKQLKDMFSKHKAGYDAFGTALINAATRGDIKSMDVILDIIGSDINLSKNPRTIETVLMNFSLSPGYDETIALKQRTELLRILNRIDPHWFEEKRGEEWITKLKPFIHASRDARTLLSWDVPGTRSFKAELMIASSYPIQDIKQLIMKQFTDLKFKDRSSNVNRATEPNRVINLK